MVRMMKGMVLPAVSLTLAFGAVESAFADIQAVTPAPCAGKDWWMPRHEAKLAEIRAASTNGGIKVAFLGDSITHFWEERPASRSHWSRTFGRNSPYKALNLGFSGDRTENLLWRIRNGELDGYEAKALVVMIGTNHREPAMDVICGIRSVIDAAFEKQPKARMVLCAIFPRGADASDPRRRKNDLVNREIRKFCDGRKIVWCDFTDRFLTADGRLSAEVMPDRLHPSVEGYEIWAASVLPYVNAILTQHGPVYSYAGTVPNRWLRPVCEGPVETIPLSRVQAANNRWTDGFYGGLWWLSRVEQARDAVQRAKGDLDLVMLGDSITHFWQQKHLDHWKAFVGNRRIVNFGCAGDTVQNVLWMIENGALDGCRTKFVSIMIGTNNNTFECDPANVAAGVMKAVRMAREKQPDAKVVLTAILPRGGSESDLKHLAARRRNEKTNAILKDFAAKEKDVLWLDMNAKFLGPNGFVPKELMADRIHPTDAGYDIWAAELDRILSASAAPSLAGLEGKPDRLVYAPTQAADAYNDHFQVIWDDGRKLYYAFWTQATREGAPDMRVVFSKSADRGRTWTSPKTLAGTPMGAEPRPRGVWQQPMLAKGGRLYCLWNQQASAEALHHGLVYGRYSDDAGETWSEPEENKSIPRQPMDDPKGVQLPNWCNWQRPIRVGEGGRFMTGCTRHVKPVDVETSPGRPVGSWVEFWQYENIDENPQVRDIRITVLNGGEKSLSIPIPGTDRFCCEEASLVKLPDGRLFALVRSRARHPFWSVSADGGRTWTAPKPLRDRTGRAFLHPNSPCPMYDLGGCAAMSGTCFALVHDAYDDSIPPLGLQKRGPLHFLRGTFDPTGEQPVAFEKEGVFLPLETDNSCYSSYTVADGERVLWFGLRKRELVGRRVD